MEPAPFEKPLSQGVRVLWMLKFHPSQEVDLFLPSPFGRNEWISANKDDTHKAQSMLSEIQRRCEEIKSDCHEAQKLDTMEQCLGKTEEICRDIKNLDFMMQHFNDFMLHFYLRKPQDPSTEERPEE